MNDITTNLNAWHVTQVAGEIPLRLILKSAKHVTWVVVDIYLLIITVYLVLKLKYVIYTQ